MISQGFKNSNDSRHVEASGSCFENRRIADEFLETDELQTIFSNHLSVTAGTD